MPAPAERIGVESYFGIGDFIRNTKIYESIIKILDQRTRQYGISVVKSTSNAANHWRMLTQKSAVVIRKQAVELENLRNQQQRWANQTRVNTQQAASSWQMFSQSAVGQVMQLRATLWQLRMAVNMVTAPFKRFIGLGQEAVGLARTRQMFAAMVGGVENLEDALKGMREVTQGTLKDTELIDGAFRMMRMGYVDTAEAAAKLTRNLTLLGRMSGQLRTPAAAMQVFQLMMSNQSKMRLDAFMLSIEQVDTRIAHLKETMAVSQEEAFRLAVLELMDESVEKMGLTVQTSATRMQAWMVQWQNFSDNMKTLMVPAFENFVSVVTGGSMDLSKTFEKIRLEWAKLVADMVAAIGANLIPAIQIVIKSFQYTAAVMRNDIAAANGLFVEIMGLTDALIGTELYMEIYNREMERFFPITQQATQAVDEHAAAVAAAADAYRELSEVQDEVNEKMLAAEQRYWAQYAVAMQKSVFAAIDAQIAAGRRREDIARQTARRIAQIEATLAQALANAIETRTSAVAAAVRQRHNAIEAAEENHQRAIRDIERRYAESADDAIRNRDALALVDARRQRSRELTQARERRDEQVDTAQDQYAEMVRTADASFRRQQDAARANYAKQLEQLRASLEERAEEQRIADERKEEDAERARDRAEGARKQAWGSKIADIYLEYLEELTAARTHYNNLRRELYKYMNDVRQISNRIMSLPMYPTTGPLQSRPPWARQKGGYAPYGQYTLGERGREYVLSASTVRFMERYMGALTQGGIRSAVGRGGEPGGPLSVNHVVTGEVQAQVSAVIEQSIAGFEGRLQAVMNRTLNDVFRTS